MLDIRVAVSRKVEKFAINDVRVVRRLLSEAQPIRDFICADITCRSHHTISAMTAFDLAKIRAKHPGNFPSATRRGKLIPIPQTRNLP